MAVTQAELKEAVGNARDFFQELANEYDAVYQVLCEGNTPQYIAANYTQNKAGATQGFLDMETAFMNYWVVMA